MSEKPSNELSASITPLILTGIFAMSLVGFFVGIHANAEPDDALVDIHQPALPSAHAVDGVVPAMSYEEMARQRLGPNASFGSSLDRLRSADEDPTAHLGQDPVARIASVAQRAERRAYTGAPPIVPHPIDQLSVESCMLCHSEGKRIGDRYAQKMPHPLYASCTQCHVEQSGDGLIAPNSFEGLESPTEGRRVWQGAPPTIPHSLNMRTDCLSCHGPNGAPGMRTTHPERKSCLQCHAQSRQFNFPPSFGAHTFLQVTSGSGQ